MSPSGAIVKANRSELPAELVGVAGITMLSDGSPSRGSGGSPSRGEPGQARPVKGVIKALVMPSTSTLCVDVEGCAHDVVCDLADTRALVVRTGAGSAYAISRLEELMRRLNSGVERLKHELRALNTKKKKTKTKE